MTEIESFATTLQQYSTAMRTTSDSDELRNYAVDGVLPRFAIIPETVEQVSQAVALANEQGLTLITRGGGSRLNLGGIPERFDVLLETTKLTRLLEHEAPDLTSHVEAGITLAEFQAKLATKGQWLALDPPDAQQATIGGILASNASGPKRLRYGTARDMVIGLRVVQASGEIARSGGSVVKNVAGYDLNKLYIGSLGSLGIIVEANFKLQPLPTNERTLILTFPNAEDAMGTVIALLGSPLTPSAIELIDSSAASDMADFFGLTLPTNGYTLAVNFEGSATSIDRQVHETRLLARKNDAILGDELIGKAQDQFWNIVREHTQGTVTCKAAVLVSKMANYLETIKQVCQKHELEAAVVAHAGNGILYIELRPVDATYRLVEAIKELRLQAQEARGSMVVERCPYDLKRRISVWGEPDQNFFLMQRIKQQFDSRGTFVKGRFVGGL
jgi:glycolate dehydrogenase FAD-binding subunit